MRNYIILNGVNSNTITGLLISTLPPITKPKQRTQIEEIDGRDGDIITKLGYSAYDKEIEIGLYGDFDIDDVIAYFNSEGTVTFSNEPDKFYNYQILDQIDYEKLIRFKKAKIKMHVQPFKYPTEEEQIQVDATVINQEGSNLTLQYTSINEAIEITVEGDTEQNGTPTPTTPVAVETVTGSQTITVCGKNLFDKDNTIANYRLDSVGQPYADKGYSLSDYIPVSPSTQYIRNIAFAWNVSICLYDKDKTFISRIQTGNVIKTTNDTYYIRTNVSTNDLNAVQLEKGNTATEYEPYQSQTYNINLGSTELCKIEDYQDRIYKNNGKWYLEKQIKKVVFNGTESWNVNGENTNYGQYVITTTDKQYGFTNMVCDRLTSVGTVNANDISGRTANRNIYITIAKSIVSYNVNNFKTWLSTNNTTVYYVLDTPTTTEITDTTLLEQLEALEGAKTYENTTNILVEGSLPAILNATTQGMPNTTINNIGNIYAKPLITIYGSGNIGVYLNQIQVLQIDLGNNGSITIDVSKMEAYNNSTKALMNRLVTGDYMKFLINSGENNIAFSGNVAGFTMDNYTRWL